MTKRPDNDGGEGNALPETEWTDAMRRVLAYTAEVCSALVGAPITVRLVDRLEDGRAARYGSRCFTFSVGHLGKQWFDQPLDAMEINGVIVHELGHEYEGTRFRGGFYRAIADLGVKLARLWAERPEVLETTADDLDPAMLGREAVGDAS